jgi:hypothetical protein
MTKVTYANAENKKAAREFLFSFFSQSNIIGLAGPDINDYLKWCADRGFKNVEIYENNSRVMVKQLLEVRSKIPIQFKFSDIINASIKEETLYDLDFCSSVLSLYHHIKKFKNEKFVMTFATRPVGVDDTIAKFFSTRREKVVSSIEKYSPIRHRVIKTRLGKYIAVPYFDTSSMVSIAKI